VAEDWRVQVVFSEAEHAGQVSDRLTARELEQDAAAELGPRVTLSRDDNELFLYTDTEARVRAAERVVRQELADHGGKAEISLTRWHDEAEEWEPLDAPFDPAADHAERIANEQQEERRQGYADWEVRVSMPSHREAKELSGRLDSEGVPHVKHWRYLLIGATDENAARARETRLRGEAPADAEIEVEGTLTSVERHNPFAAFGAFTGEP